MRTLKTLAAAALAAGLAGAAQAAPALNTDVGTRTAATADSAATPVYYSCVPVYRWIYTYYGWQQVYAGQRCPSYGYYGYPHGTFRFSSPGVRIRIGF